MVAERQRRLVTGVGENRHHAVRSVGERRREGVEHRIKVDQVRPGTACRIEVQEHVTVRVEAAPVADVAVVVVDADSVVELVDPTPLR